jgi:hypothetical protein
LGGLWAFPEREIATATGEADAAGADPRAAATSALRARGFSAHPAAVLAPVRHAFTHLRATYHPVVLRLPAGADRARDGSGPAGAPASGGDGRECRWVPVASPGVALPTAQKRMLTALLEWLGSPRG